MVDSLFAFLTRADELFWGYVAFVVISILGSYLTIKNGFFQVRQLPNVVKTFISYMKKSPTEARGIHPLKTFFASVGGMIGIGNIVGIVTAIQVGGPGALFWVWVTGLIGAIIKYGEIYLGLKYRVENANGGYDGGPIFFLKVAYKNGFIPLFVAFLLCIYGVEIYQFSVITESVSTNWHINRYLVVVILLGLVAYAGLGGVKRTAKICSWVMPFFLIMYLAMSLWIIGQEILNLPAILVTVLKSAFTGHAAVGGFVGSSVILTIQHGIARAAYSADLGIGYDSIIQSESSTVYPERQAGLAILGVFIDNFICTLSILLVLVSGVWTLNPVGGSQLVQTALAQYFPYMELFMPFFLIICGYTTIIAYFCVGLKCARHLMPKYGTKIYMSYAMVAFVLFTFTEQSKALLIMSLAGALLLIINLVGIFRLRKEIVFGSQSVPAKAPATLLPSETASPKLESL